MNYTELDKWFQEIKKRDFDLKNNILKIQIKQWHK